MDTESGMKGKGNADSQSMQLIHFKNDDERTENVYKYLWISEKFYLQGIIQFVNLAKSSPPRNLNDLESPLNCIFTDIIRLDFSKFNTVLTEYQAVIKEEIEAETRAEEERKKALEEAEASGNPPPEAEEVEESPAKKRVKRVSDFLQVMARAAQFALNSRSWLQLVSIILYTWNTFTYDMINPLELSRVGNGWHSLVILAECSLYMLEYLQRGGKLRTLAG